VLLAALWPAGELALTSVPTATPEDQPPAKPRYTKGKSPGTGGFHIARYDEDYSYLRDPAKATSFLDRFKFIRLDEAGDVYLTLNGEARLRFDYTENKNFGVAPTARVQTRPGAPLVLGASRPPPDSDLLKQRYMVGADLHVGPFLRFYGELWHAEQTGHGSGPVIPASQRNDLELINGFAEFMLPLDSARTGLRVGRQELFFGNSHNVAANIATSLPDPIFDGVRAYADWGSARVDVFAYNAYRYKDGWFAGDDNPHRNLWGVYGSFDLPKGELFGETLTTTLDAFYYGFRAAPNNNGAGTGLYNAAALRTAATVSATAGFLVADDHRHTLGLRAFGTAGNVNYDWDAAVQRGSYGPLDVRAWAFNTDTGYTFADLPWRPRLGTHIDGASGGADRAGGTIGTYQPMFPDTLYHMPNSFFSPTNFYDIAPRVRVTPVAGVSAEFSYGFFWRQSQDDAVYTGNWKGANGTNALAASALVPGRVIGRMPNLTVTWAPVRNLILRLTAAEFIPGSALKAVQGKNTTYVNAQMTAKF
jgi:hypothetical protein